MNKSGHRVSRDGDYAVTFLPPQALIPPEIREWQLLYVITRHEKVVASQLALLNIEHSLPLSKSIRIWNKRRVSIDLPLFPSYVFVNCDEFNRQAIFAIPGIVRFVTYQGQPATVAHDQLLAIVSALKVRDVHPCPYLFAGQRVRITSGPLAGIVGVIDRMKGLRVIVSVDSIASSIAIEACPEDLTSITDAA